MSETFTAEELRRQADDLSELSERLGNMLSFAATLAAREGQTCDGCRFAGSRFATVSARTCTLPEAVEISLVKDRTNIVPLTVNGQPFGCKAWQAKEPR